MGRKKISIDQLQAEVQNILKKYENDKTKAIEESAVQYAKIGKAKLSANSPKRRGKYSKGWAYKKQKPKKGNFSVTVHNKSHPGLTHLLEKGHALRQGGRSPAEPHIAPVEEELNEGFYNEVIKELQE